MSYLNESMQLLSTSFNTGKQLTITALLYCSTKLITNTYFINAPQTSLLQTAFLALV